MSGTSRLAGHRTGVRILQVTDLHILAGVGQTLLGVDTEKSCRNVFDKIRQEEDDVALILLTGDLVQDPCISSYSRLYSWLQEMDWAFYCLPGNHDDPRLMVSTLVGNNVHFQPHILLDHWQIICLDSAIWSSPGGYLDSKQLALLENCLVAYPEHHALIALHHHAVTSGSAWMDTMVLGNADEFLAILERFQQVRLVLSGHVHQVMDVNRGSLRLLATPSTCFQFTPQSEQFALDEIPPGYRWLELFDDGTFDTGVRRLEHSPKGLDMASEGY